MNGYLALSDQALAAHRRATPLPRPATAPSPRPRVALESFSEALASSEVLEAPLTARRRNALPDSAFVFPDDRSYPIDTPERARAALSRIEQFGSDDEIRRVRAAVRRRYPDMEVS